MKKPMENIELSYEQMLHLRSLNNSLLHVTGVDFMSELEDLAASNNKTEKEVQEFFKKNYPGASNLETLNQEDKIHLSLLMSFYLLKVEEHDELAQEIDASQLAYCIPKECQCDQSFRSRHLANFPLPAKEKSLVTGFFPKN